MLWLRTLAGCGATSVEPASDDTNTTLDPRLVGFWRIEEPSKPDREPPNAVVSIGRKQGSAYEMDLVAVGLGVNQEEAKEGSQATEPEISVNRGVVRATRIGGRTYASVPVTILGPPKDPEAPGVPPWFIVRYDMPDDATVHVRLMNDDRVGADIVEGLVDGKVERTGLVKNVLLSASTPDLRQYLERRGDEVFQPDSYLVLKRIRLNEGPAVR